MSKTPKLFVLGDSISMGYGPFLEKMLAGKWQYARKTEALETEVGGATPPSDNGRDSRDCLTFLTALHGKGKLNADVLLLNCGLHDIKYDATAPQRQLQVPLEDYRANL